MQIVHARWTAYQVPFHTSFVTAHGPMQARAGAIIELLTSRDDITGIGDIAPLPEFGGGTLAEALAALPAVLNDIRGKTGEDTLAYIQTQLYAGKLPASTACGLEMAVLDALAKTLHCSVSMLLGAEYNFAPRSLIPVNAVIGMQDGPAAIQQARQAVAAGFSCVKLKMGCSDPHSEIERVSAVRAAIGPAIALRLDANASWTYEQALAILHGCAALHIQYVEQPLPAHDIEGMRMLQRSVCMPLAADEAASDLSSVHTLLQAQAAQVLIIKPQLVGGLGASREVMEMARRQGVNCVVTSTFETGIGLAAVLHLAAASPEVTWACGLATLDRLVDDLLLDGLLVRNGMMAVPADPGLGIWLDRAALMKYSCATGEG